MAKDRYAYPAIFHYATDGISVEFPDLPGCITCGGTTDEAMNMAKEALELYLYCLEKDGEPVPEPAVLTDVSLKDNEQLIMINVFLPPVRYEQENKSVKKTLTVPKWLNDIAEKQQVNFSQILQAGLKSYLGIQGPPAK